MQSVIKAEGLKKYFGEVKAVDDIVLDVKEGELFGFLGVNGAGKSTTISMLCTLLKPTAGKLEVCGFPVGKEDDEIRKRIGVVYQNNCLDDRLTVKENLFTRGALYEKKKSRLIENVHKVCDMLELGDVYNRRFAVLSGGQKRRCEMARALLNTPRIMFLDEPTTGLDPAARKKVWECLRFLQKEENMTVFLTTHYMEEAARAAHISIIDGGKIKEYGTPFALKETYARDKLRLIPKKEAWQDLEKKLAAMQVNAQKKESGFTVLVKDSLESLPILKETEEMLAGYEMLQGTMDDVFLTVRGECEKNF